MTASLRRACAEVGAPLGLVLEGGYAVDALAASVAALMPVLGAPEVPPAVDAARAPARRARRWERLARWWPSRPLSRARSGGCRRPGASMPSSASVASDWLSYSPEKTTQKPPLSEEKSSESRTPTPAMPSAAKSSRLRLRVVLGGVGGEDDGPAGLAGGPLGDRPRRVPAASASGVGVGGRRRASPAARLRRVASGVGAGRASSAPASAAARAASPPAGPARPRRCRRRAGRSRSRRDRREREEQAGDRDRRAPARARRRCACRRRRRSCRHHSCSSVIAAPQRGHAPRGGAARARRVGRRGSRRSRAPPRAAQRVAGARAPGGGPARCAVRRAGTGRRVRLGRGSSGSVRAGCSAGSRLGGCSAAGSARLPAAPARLGAAASGVGSARSAAPAARPLRGRLLRLVARPSGSASGAGGGGGCGIGGTGRGSARRAGVARTPSRSACRSPSRTARRSRRARRRRRRCRRRRAGTRPSRRAAAPSAVLERGGLGVEAREPLDLAADDRRVRGHVAAAGAVDLVDEPAEVAQHQLARAAQVAEPAAQPAAAARPAGGVAGSRRIERRAGRRPGPPGRRSRRPSARPSRRSRRRRPRARPSWARPPAPAACSSAGLAGVGGARALDASQESAHGRSGARSPTRSNSRV